MTDATEVGASTGSSKSEGLSFGGAKCKPQHEPDMTRWVTCREGGVWDTAEVPRTANPCKRCGVLVVFDTQPSRWPVDEPEFIAVQRQNEASAKRDRPGAPHSGFFVSPNRARMLADIDAADEDD